MAWLMALLNGSIACSGRPPLPDPSDGEKLSPSAASRASMITAIAADPSTAPT